MRQFRFQRPISGWLLLLSLALPAPGQQALPEQIATLVEAGRYQQALPLFHFQRRSVGLDAAGAAAYRRARMLASIQQRYADPAYTEFLEACHPQQAAEWLRRTRRRIQTLYPWPLDPYQPTRYARDQLALAIGAVSQQPWDRAARIELPAEAPDNWPQRLSALPSRTQTRVLIELCNGLVESLDPYGRWLTPGMMRRVAGRSRGRYVGIGVRVKRYPDRLQLVEVYPDSPAAAAGLAANQWITHLDGVPVAQLSGEQVAGRMGGPVGSGLQVVIASAEQARTVNLVRRPVDKTALDRVYLLDESKKIGTLRVVSFHGGTAGQLAAALDELERLGARRLLIDLRGNGGGTLGSAAQAAGLFLDRGLLGTLHRGPQPRRVSRYQLPDGHRRRSSAPAHILVDRHTASAAEFFAAALQRHGRATVVGEPSYGKDRVQSVVPLGADEMSGCGLLLTSGFFRAADDPAERPFALQIQKNFRAELTAAAASRLLNAAAERRSSSGSD